MDTSQASRTEPYACFAGNEKKFTYSPAEMEKEPHMHDITNSSKTSVSSEMLYTLKNIV